MSASAHSSAPRRGTWLRRIFVLFVLASLAYAGLLVWVSTSRVQRAFAARISAAFGRPVEVSNFSVNILDGPRLVANYVTVSEDPRFGREYFLRADRLTASVRWTALLRGRLEFDTVSFTRPSLNLVRNADGTWNLENWLPSPDKKLAPPPAAPPPAAPQPLLTRINIDTGRINFKRGVDKHPFAFTAVEGYVERAADGRWRVDLEANVMRAGVTVQEPGTLRLQGSIGSAASRIAPAALVFTWQDASLSDALRLARGNDHGVRGDFELSVTASTPQVSAVPSVWTLNGDLRLRDVHGWNLARRTDDPDLNLRMDAKWTPKSARIEFSKIVLDAPNSSVRASGFVQWAAPQGSGFRVLSTGVALDDLFDWYRAFRPGVAPDLRVQGSAGLDAELGGWPTSVQRATLASDGAQTKIPGLAEPLRMGRAVLQWTPAKIELLPVQFSIAPVAAPGVRAEVSRVFRLSLSGAGAPPAVRNCAALFCVELKLNLVGQMDRLQDFLAATRAFGWPLDGGWAIDGPASFSITGTGRMIPFALASQGAVHFAGTRLVPPFLNQPVRFKDAMFTWSPPPGERRLNLLSADVFGGRWNGTVFSKSGGPWEFSLSADRLEIAAVNQWLNPARQQGLFQRLIGSAATRRGTAEYEDQLSRLRASGQVRVDQLILAPLAFRKLSGSLNLEGRKLSLSAATAEFFGGKASGTFSAELALEPKYEARAKFERVNLLQLTAATVTLKNIFSGTAGGELTLSTRGTGRDNLLAALDAQGSFDFRDAQFRGLDLAESIRAGDSRPGVTSLRTAFARVNLSAQKIQFEELRLNLPAAEWQAEGTMDFTRQLDLRLHSQSQATDPFTLSGLLAAPQLVPATPAKRP